MKKKLLLADDSITIQKVVGIIFTPENYDLLIAGDGDRAYEMALEHQPDLVIADVAMPGKNGFELCREIKSHPALAQTSVLLLPGAFEQFDEARAVEVCADGWLTKPFESQALLDKVAALSEMPPLRLVPAEEPVPEEPVPEEPVPGVNAVASEVSEEIHDELLSGDEEEDTLPPREDVIDQADEVLSETEIAAADDNDGGLWGEVSFEEDDLKPHDLLAAGDQDDDNEIVDDEPEPDETPADESRELTPEQLAPYATAMSQTETHKKMDDPGFEPVTAEAEEEEEKQEETQDDRQFGFVTAEDQEQEAGQPEENEFSAATQSEEHSPPFGFVSEDTDDATMPADDTDDVLELMEDDLDQEEALVEDSDTFIDLTETDTDIAEEGSVVGTSESPEAAEAMDSEDVLELTEGDVVELSESEIAEEDPAAADTSFAAAPEESDEDDEVFVAGPDEDDSEENNIIAEDDGFGEEIPQQPVTDEVPLAEDEQFFTDDEDELPDPEAEQHAEPETGRRDDDLFVDEDDDVIDTEEEVGDDFATTIAEPVTAPDTVSAVAAVEEQLRQLPEEELKEIIGKVAGPMIEKMAREMLEQTVWEVVPDLAETMISAEIEKIKRGEP